MTFFSEPKKALLQEERCLTMLSNLTNLYKLKTKKKNKVEQYNDNTIEKKTQHNFYQYIANKSNFIIILFRLKGLKQYQRYIASPLAAQNR